MNTLLEKENPTLRMIAQPILKEEFNTQWLRDLVECMMTIMKEKGAVGVAAPQIGVSKRVIVFGTAYARRRKPEMSIPDSVLINPAFKILSEYKELGFEGCLNCGDLMGEVSRASEIKYSGYDLNGNYINKQAHGLEARILQHEIDHLNGFLFIDHISDKNTLITYEELQKRQEKNET